MWEEEMCQEELRHELRQEIDNVELRHDIEDETGVEARH